MTIKYFVDIIIIDSILDGSLDLVSPKAVDVSAVLTAEEAALVSANIDLHDCQEEGTVLRTILVSDPVEVASVVVALVPAVVASPSYSAAALAAEYDSVLHPYFPIHFGLAEHLAEEQKDRC